MATVLYYVRTTTKKSNPKVNIRVRFAIGKTFHYGKTQYLIELKNWNQKTQKVKQELFKDTGVKLNKQLLELEAHLINAFNQIENKKNIDSKWLQDKIDTYYQPLIEKEEKEVYFIDFVNDYIERLNRKTNYKNGKKIANTTIKKHKTSQARLGEFIKRYNPKLLLKDVDVDFYDNYIEYLTFEKEYAVNTINKYIACLKVYLNEANRKGFHIKLEDFIKPSEESDNVYLTKDELYQLYEFDLKDNPLLEKVRDLFVIGCWTGLRFSDLTSLSKDSIRYNTIAIKTQKTGIKVVIPMFNHTAQILEKYNYDLPVLISNQKFNEYIKEACKAAGINESTTKTITKGGLPVTKAGEKWEFVSSHTARRSFASNLYKAGLSHISIMEITGHTTEASFLKYIKVKPEEHAKKMQEFFDKLAAFN
jgi:integrase